MAATTGTVATWGGRLILGLGLLAAAGAFVRYSYTAEAYFQRSATGTVVAEGGFIRSFKNRKYPVTTVFVEYTDAAGKLRVTECEKPKGLNVGSETTVWYSPWCARDGRLTVEATGDVPTEYRDGLLVVFGLFGALFAWQSWHAVVGLFVGLRDLPGDYHALRRSSI